MKYFSSTKQWISPSIHLLSFLILCAISSCSSQNEFQFKGEYPDWQYINLFNSQEVGSIHFDTESIQPRNRIYVSLDQFMNISLNGHAVTSNEFSSGFKYVYSNPTQLSHLPESPKKVVVFYALDFPANATAESVNDPRISEFSKKMGKLIQEVRETYTVSEYQLSIKQLNPKQLETVEKMFPLNIVLYSKSYAMMDLKEDKGISVKLPPWSEDETIATEVKGRNIILIEVKSKDQLFLRKKPIKVDDLSNQIKKMILNQRKNPDYPESPTNVIVSLRNTRETDYKFYLKVYNALKQAYSEMWEERALRYFAKSYTSLANEQAKLIRAEIPLLISESEPTSENK